MQTSPHRDVQFLKAPANAKERLAAVDAGPDQGQRDRIAVAVKLAMGRGFRLAIFGRMHIGPAPRQQKPVTQRQKFIDLHQTRIGGQNDRHASRHFGHSGGIDVPRAMHRIAIIHHMRV